MASYHTAVKAGKLKYLLIFLAILVWSKVLFQFLEISSKDNEEPEVSLPDKAQEYRSHEPIESLSLRYEDPFIRSPRKTVIKKTEKPPDKQTRDKKPAIAAKSVIWPEIEYKGCISGMKGENKLALMKLNGIEYALKEGETRCGVRVADVYQDSVVLAVLDSRKIIRK